MFETVYNKKTKTLPEDCAMNRAQITELFEIFESINDSPKSELKYRNAFELLCAVVLSAQATDASVNRVTPELFRLAPDSEAMSKLPVEEIERIISSIGLYRAKARYLSGLARKLVSDFGGEVPMTESELTSLPGVGIKTARVVMNVAFGMNTIAVDTHIFRVADRIGLSHANTPDLMSDVLARRIPSRFLKNAHHHLILHGRYVCTARKPKCDICPVSSLCHFFKTASMASK